MLFYSQSLLGKKKKKNHLSQHYKQISDPPTPLNQTSVLLGFLWFTQLSELRFHTGWEEEVFLNHSPKLKIKTLGYFSCLKCYHTQLVMFSCTETLQGNLSIKDNLWQISRHRTHTIHWGAAAFQSSAATLSSPLCYFFCSWASQICSGLYKEISKGNHTITLTGSQLPSRGKTFQIQATCVIHHHPSRHK